MRRFATLVVSLAVVLATALPVRAGWDPAAWAEEETVEVRTVNDGEAYWSYVWVVVLDGEPYLRLGDRAAWRFEENAEKPLIGLRVAGEEFERVRVVPAPEKEEAVADAMADKYWSDLFIRFFPHPLTVRLVPDDAE